VSNIPPEDLIKIDTFVEEIRKALIEHDIFIDDLLMIEFNRKAGIMFLLQNLGDE
jgi:hypothetical protein